MKLRILLFSMGITLVCIMLFSLASTQVYYRSSVDDAGNYLRVYMNVYDPAIYTPDGSGAQALSSALGGARVTFIDSSGIVIADSRAEGITENHSSRAEIAAALVGGEGFSVRDSDTLGESMVYYCKKVSDALLVRIAVAVPSEWSIFVSALPTLGTYIALDIIACVALAFIATHFILSPVQALAKSAAADMEVKSKYHELLPIAEILSERNKSIERQMREIAEERDAAERARSSKDEFISNVTHEMNTPLTSIRGYAELLNAGELPEENKRKAYATILRESERLTSLIACIINYSEIDSDGLPSYEVDFTALARETLNAVLPEAEKKGVTLIDEIGDNVKVMSRRERVSEVLGNLVRNAVRYNKDGGSVTVRLGFDKLVVEDTGIGISEENKEKIFDRFFTIDRSHGGKNGGFGLGLAVVKKICRAQGWKIYVDSKLGEGSKFTIEF